jgi:hypothetical protein
MSGSPKKDTAQVFPWVEKQRGGGRKTLAIIGLVLLSLILVFFSIGLIVNVGDLL